MELADLLRSRIKRKQEKRPPVYEKTPDIVEMLRKATAAKPTDSTSTSSEPVKMPPYISLDMYIAFREEFASGWNIWLGDEQVTKLEPELKQEMPSMSFDEKAAMFFRLSVWTNKKQDADAQNITEIPDGAEVYVERVTGLTLFENKMGQGNTNRIDMVTKVEDTGSDLENTSCDPPVSESQSTEGNQTDVDHLSPKFPKKRRAAKASRDVAEAGAGEECFLAEQPNKVRAPKKSKTE